MADRRESYGQYIEFLAGLIVFLCIPYLILGGYDWFVDALGFIGSSTCGFPSCRKVQS